MSQLLLFAARPTRLPSLLNFLQRTSRPIFTAMAVFAFGAIACHAQSLDGITTVTTNFLTWFRAFLGVVGVIAIAWGGAKIMFSGEVGRGLVGVFAGIVGLFIAGYAQQIVSLFYSTSS
jgi:TrbC/VIRB2 pilin